MNESPIRDCVAVVVAYQSWVSLDNHVDYALVELDDSGECWARKLIRKIRSWNIFSKVVLLVLEGSSCDTYRRICEEEGAELKMVPPNLYQWPRSWYPWAWNFDNLKNQTQMILAWVCWLQKSLNPQTYLLFSITGGFFSKTQILDVLSHYSRGHRAAFHNQFGSGGYVIDTEYLQTVFPANFEQMALLPTFENFSHLEQTFDDQKNRNEAFQGRVKFPMGLWSRRHWDLLQNYMEAFPEEAYDLEFNSQMIAYLSENYLEHQKDWLNTLEIVFEGDAQNWLSVDHLKDIAIQAQYFGRVTFVLDFTKAEPTEEIEKMIHAVSDKLFIVVKLPIDFPQPLLISVLRRVDYLEFNLPSELNYVESESFIDQLFYQNWTLVFEDFLQNQKPCFGLSVNIPKDSMQKIAMLNYFKDKVDFNPFLISEKVQGAGYPRTPNLKFENVLSKKMRNDFKSELGVLNFDQNGRGPDSKTVYESTLKQQLRLSNSNG